MPIYVGDYLPVLGCELDDTRSSFNAESKDALLDSWYAFNGERLRHWVRISSSTCYEHVSVN